MMTDEAKVAREARRANLAKAAVRKPREEVSYFTAWARMAQGIST